MPVIGRLDKQVDDVLIDPVGERRGRRRDDAAGHAPPDARRGAADEGERGQARAAGDETSRARASRGEDQARGDEQLPVWLL